MKDGSRVSFSIKDIRNDEEYGKAHMEQEAGEWNINFVTGKIVEIGEIESVVINRKEIPVKP